MYADVYIYTYAYADVDTDIDIAVVLDTGACRLYKGVIVALAVSLQGRYGAFSNGFRAQGFRVYRV